MMDVFKCLKLDASLQAGQDRQADWLKQKLGKGVGVSAVEVFFCLGDHCCVAYAVVGEF